MTAADLKARVVAAMNRAEQDTPGDWGEGGAVYQERWHDVLSAMADAAIREVRAFVSARLLLTPAETKALFRRLP